MQSRHHIIYSSGLRKPSQAMESTFLPQEDAALLALRRRRKKLIAIFSTLLVSLALIISALITFLIHDTTVPETFDRTNTVDPSLRAFCSVVNSTSSCLASFDPIIYTKRVTNPNQIFTLSLETATEELQTLISLLSNSTDRSNLSDCSNSLREALNQINGTLSLVDQLQSSGFQRDKTMNLIEAAEEDLKACAAADGSGKQVEEKVERAKMFLGYSRDFLYGYDGVWKVSDAAKYYRHRHWLVWELEENVFVFVLFGLQLSFLGFLLCSVLRIAKH